jgi:hypothetical protein
VRLAYADPPYFGCCDLYGHHHPDGRCWDDLTTHVALIARLEAEFSDGWSMSLSSPSLRHLLPLCPEGVRVAAWAKPFAVFKPNVNPGYTWEPIIWQGGRKRDRYEATVKDHVIATDSALVESITLQKGLTGAKPRRFAFWVFDLLGAQPTDDFVDLFPGTGVIGKCWDEFCGRTRAVQEGLAL